MVIASTLGLSLGGGIGRDYTQGTVSLGRRGASHVEKGPSYVEREDCIPGQVFQKFLFMKGDENTIKH